MTRLSTVQPATLRTRLVPAYLLNACYQALAGRGHEVIQLDFVTSPAGLTQAYLTYTVYDPGQPDSVLDVVLEDAGNPDGE